MERQSDPAAIPELFLGLDYGHFLLSQRAGILSRGRRITTIDGPSGPILALKKDTCSRLAVSSDLLRRQIPYHLQLQPIDSSRVEGYPSIVADLFCLLGLVFF
jgi:hypothetical protein